jgi:hypothetical protein
MNKEDLIWLNCPFCGSIVETESTKDYEIVRCTLCLASMIYSGSAITLNSMWNNRSNNE